MAAEKSGVSLVDLAPVSYTHLEGYGAGLTPLLDASGRPVVSSYTGHGGEDVKY